MEDTIDEFRGHVQRAAEPVRAGEKVYQQIERAAHRLAIGRSKAKKLWYGLPVLILDHEARNIRRRARAIEARLDAIKREAEAIDRALNRSDEDARIFVGESQK